MAPVRLNVSSRKIALILSGLNSSLLITSSLTKVVSNSFLDARDFYEILRDFCESSDLLDVLGFRFLFRRMVISYCFLAAEIAPNVGERRC